MKWEISFFGNGTMKCVQDYCSSMNVFSTVETVEFTDSSNKKISRTLAYISDPKGFIEDILKGRGIKEPKIVLGSDYGKDKLIVTASIYDESDLLSDVNGVKPSSPQAAPLLAMVDFVRESHANLTTIFEKLGFPWEFAPNIRFICDLKLSNYMCGLFGCQSIYSCIYGECCKVKNGVPTGKWDGRWEKGPLRTLNSCKNIHEKWVNETGGRESQLKRYFGCKFPPIPIYSDDLWDVPILKLFPPCPLHLLLGKGSLTDLIVSLTLNGKSNSKVKQLEIELKLRLCSWCFEPYP